MSNLINECEKLNVNSNSYSSSEEHFSPGEERLDEQSTSLFWNRLWSSTVKRRLPAKCGRRAWRISKNILRERHRRQLGLFL